MATTTFNHSPQRPNYPGGNLIVLAAPAALQVKIDAQSSTILEAVTLLRCLKKASFLGGR